MGRPLDKGTTFVTGGDVSRFQRTTVPPKTAPQQAAAPAPAQAAAPAGGGNAAPVYKGPSVRITRGKETTETPVSKTGAAIK